ncbi:GntR family transcriptional regulator [Cryptosporangium sp. NPDC048952]|uniref:GntR family transcriptional regulator n=1 Tax=Cryptosporangium sp. NPDC048952 TaxID=3363961 RepID=UPI0037247FAF
MLSGRIYDELRDAILRGDFAPGDALKPQELAGAHGVSLAVVREALVRLVGDGLADRLTNRGFAVPLQSDRRWQDLVEARCTVEVATLRLAIERGDLDWEARVRATHHRLARTPAFDGSQITAEWSRAHRDFHRALLEGSGNTVLLETFDRMWLAGELVRRWSIDRAPIRDYLGEHRAIEEATLARDADVAASLLTRHLTRTVDTLD